MKIGVKITADHTGDSHKKNNQAAIFSLTREE